MKQIIDCKIGDGCIIHENVDLYKCEIGSNTKVKSFVYIQEGVKIGKNCKIEPFVFIPSGVIIEDNVFIGPGVFFTNDMYPRATNSDWKIKNTIIKEGASIGAGSTLVCGITIGKLSMIGAGSVVTKNIPDRMLAYGNPARPIKEIND